jgi:hypothetical protein
MGVTHMKIFSMEVIKILDEYPEKNIRKRKWFSPEEAADKVTIFKIPQMITLLKSKVK